MLYNQKIREASEEKYDARTIGVVLTEILQSNSPLAKNYRRFLASKENSAEKGGEV